MFAPGQQRVSPAAADGAARRTTVAAARAGLGGSRRGRAGALAAAALVAVIAAPASDARVGAQEPPADPAAFSATVDNPLFPLAKLRFTRSLGAERTESGRRIRLRVEIRVLKRKMTVAGVPVTVVEDNDFENGRLVEHTFDYFSQDRDGNVWYFGERIDEYEEGRIVGHEGQWLAGRRGAKPGLFMPAALKVGATFAQERAPGVAEDRSTVLAVGLRVKTPARVFNGCIKVRDFSRLDHTNEFKYYCPGVGIAREVEGEARFDVVTVR